MERRIIKNYELRITDYGSEVDIPRTRGTNCNYKTWAQLTSQLVAEQIIN